MIAVGNDHAAVDLKEEVLKLLELRNIEYIDAGVTRGQKSDYPDVAQEVCRNIVEKKCDKGILLCGTGVGMAITANKVKGIRACSCSDVFSAKMSVMHNNSNVLCLGERVVGAGLMKEIVNAWLDAKFEGGRHGDRVDMISTLEDRNFK